MQPMCIHSSVATLLSSPLLFPRPQGSTPTQVRTQPVVTFTCCGTVTVRITIKYGSFNNTAGPLHNSNTGQEYYYLSRPGHNRNKSPLFFKTKQAFTAKGNTFTKEKISNMPISYRRTKDRSRAGGARYIHLKCWWDFLKVFYFSCSVFCHPKCNYVVHQGLIVAALVKGGDDQRVKIQPCSCLVWTVLSFYSKWMKYLVAPRWGLHHIISTPLFPVKLHHQKLNSTPTSTGEQPRDHEHQQPGASTWVNY